MACLTVKPKQKSLKTYNTNNKLSRFMLKNLNPNHIGRRQVHSPLPPFSKKCTTTTVCVCEVVWCVYFFTNSSLLPVVVPQTKTWPVTLQISFQIGWVSQEKKSKETPDPWKTQGIKSKHNTKWRNELLDPSWLVFGCNMVHYF